MVSNEVMMIIALAVAVAGGITIMHLSSKPEKDKKTELKKNPTKLTPFQSLLET